MSQPIIDAHQHFWTIVRTDYGWLTPELGELYQDYLPQHVAHDLAANNVAASVLIQAAPTIEETRYLLKLADKAPFVHGVVGWVDLSSDEAVNDIKKLAHNPYFKGVRPMLQDLDNPNWINEHTKPEAIQALIDHRIKLDLLIKDEHIEAALAFAKQWPDLYMVIDHCAKPNFESDDFGQWQQHMQTFAALPNVYTKLSGFYESGKQALTAEQYQPYIDTLMQSFTSDKIIWGSNWPMLTLWGSYTEWLNTCKQCLAKYTEQDQKHIFFNNALVFYELVS